MNKLQSYPNRLNSGTTPHPSLCGCGLGLGRGHGGGCGGGRGGGCGGGRGRNVRVHTYAHPQRMMLLKHFI